MQKHTVGPSLGSGRHSQPNHAVEPMGIDLKWENEDGGPIDEILDPQMCMSHLILRTDLKGTACLRFIDPYGDTTFNQLQIPILIEELKAVSENVRDKEVKDHLRRVTELAEKTNVKSILI